MSRTKTTFFRKNEKTLLEKTDFSTDNRFLIVNNGLIESKVMLSTIDILSLVEEQKTVDLRQLAKKLEIPLDALKEIVIDLSNCRLIEYNEKTGKINLPTWLTKIDREIGKLKPAIGAIILPRYQEIKVQDITLGNFTKNDLELKVRLKARLKEIAICDVG